MEKLTPPDVNAPDKPTPELTWRQRLDKAEEKGPEELAAEARRLGEGFKAAYVGIGNEELKRQFKDEIAFQLLDRKDHPDVRRILEEFGLIEKQTSEPQPSDPPRPTSAFETFTEQSKAKNPNIKTQVRQLWQKYTGKEASQVTEAEDVLNHEKNVGLADLKEARAQLAALRAFERRTAVRKLEDGELEKAEKKYADVFKASLINALKSHKEAKEAAGEPITQEALRAITSQLLIEEMVRRSEVEAAVLEARGGRGTKFTNWIRNHSKARIAAGLILTGASVGLAVAGAGLPALAVGAARVGMRGLGGYEAAQGVQEKWGAWRAHKVGDGQEPNVRSLRQEETEQMGSEQQTQRLANLLSAAAEIGRGKGHEEADTQMIQQLEAGRHAEYLATLKSMEARFTGQNFLKGIDEAAATLITEQLKAENARLVSDKEVASKRFKRAAVIGAVLALAPVAGRAAELWGGGSDAVDNPTKTKPTGSIFERPDIEAGVPDPDKPKAPIDNTPEVPDTGGAQPPGESDPIRSSEGSPERPRVKFADREWNIQPGDSQWRIAHEILSYHHQSFGELGTEQKLVAVDRLTDLMGSKDLIHPGDIQEVKGQWVKDALESAQDVNRR